MSYIGLGQVMCPDLAIPGYTNCPAGDGCILVPDTQGCTGILSQPILQAVGTPSIAPAWVATSIKFTDVSKPGGPYSVGDQWTLEISGTPSTPVTATVSQNGASPSTSNVGTTDSSGNLTLSGTFGSGDAGSWQESYLVGSGSPASLSFNVAAPPSPGGTQQNSNPAPAPVAPAATGLDLSFLTSDLGPLPLWAWLAGGIVLLAVVKK